MDDARRARMRRRRKLWRALRVAEALAHIIVAGHVLWLVYEAVVLAVQGVLSQIHVG